MATGIKDKVAIIGMGCTKFGERWDVGAEELMVEAFQECIEDAGIDKKDIQAAWFGTCMDEVNVGKSGVSRPWTSKLLGFTLTNSVRKPQIRLHWKTVKRLKERVRELTARSCGRSLASVVGNLTEYLRGWWNYFGRIESRNRLATLDRWLRRRLRMLVWKQWKNPRTKVRNLEKLGIDHINAMICGNARKKHWRMSKVKWVAIAMPERYFIDKGLYLPGN